ncbi:MAG: molybdopterin molybdotransferase MoeA [Candidatus Nezhaarchaeota archaeon]|nr:molybdopterin molybdotransferase MoeA [Candidatus Nezhaarchaeota archaeon]
MPQGRVREDWKRVLRLTSPQEAAERLLEYLKVKPRIEEVSVADCLGRVLAEDVVSSQDIPPYNCACFEGYAINSDDTAKATRDNPADLRVVGRVLPETKNIPTVRRGEAVFLVTGAPIPQGADCLVKVEEARLEGDRILVFRSFSKFENVALKGEDVRSGETLLKAGRVIRPIDVGLLMGLGFSKVKVYAKPRIAIISVGRELYLKSLECRDPPPNNYAYVVKGLVECFGGSADVLGVFPDDVELVKGVLLRALEAYDAVFTMGSCSIGINDAVPDAVNELGKPGVLVHGLALNPGKPAGFGIVWGKPVIMLPGHIVSAVAAFYVLCLPLIGAMTGRNAEELSPHVYAEMEDHEETGGACRFLRANVKDINGRFVAKPMHGGANVMVTLLRSNYFAVLPPKTEVKKGEMLKMKALTLLDALPR